MKLIVEAGTTKTDSVLISKEKEIVKNHSSGGINPVSDIGYLKAVEELVIPFCGSDINEIFYYGSGCINREVNSRVANDLMSRLETTASIEVKDDLIGTARGLCQRRAGIVAILGTGSNIGYYDGNEIVDRINSGGYLLGDEGSGFRIGQAIYRLFAREKLNPSVTKDISEHMSINRSDAIHHLYRHSNPRQYLASFAKCISLLDEKSRNEVLESVFELFIERLILPLYSQYQSSIHICGSVGFHFQTYLNHLFEKFNILAASFERSPLDGLIRYHTDE